MDSKIDILVEDFHLRLSDDEKNHFYSLHSELAVDQYAHKLLVDKL